MEKAISRKFLGNIFPTNTLETKELQAYLKGYTYFFYKKDEYKIPIKYKVRQEYIFE